MIDQQEELGGFCTTMIYDTATNDYNINSNDDNNIIIVIIVIIILIT